MPFTHFLRRSFCHADLDRMKGALQPERETVFEPFIFAGVPRELAICEFSPWEHSGKLCAKKQIPFMSPFRHFMPWLKGQKEFTNPRRKRHQNICISEITWVWKAASQGLGTFGYAGATIWCEAFRRHAGGRVQKGMHPQARAAPILPYPILPNSYLF